MGTVVVGKQEYLVKPGDIVYIPQYLGHFTAPTKDLILRVVNIPYFDKDDQFDLRVADDATRKAVCYDHAQYLRFAYQ
jgi:oxalate decarboxylase/phosphoglucose isomerase-like protein (cupin superfamily)